MNREVVCIFAEELQDLEAPIFFFFFKILFIYTRTQREAEREAGSMQGARHGT